MQILFVSLGCDKNLVDTEHMLGSLPEGEFSVTDEETEADVIVINTCCFIEDATQESIDTVLEMAKYRKEGKCRALIIAGCMAERYREEVLKEFPEADAIIGTGSTMRLYDAIRAVLDGKKGIFLEDPSGDPERRKATEPSGRKKKKRVITTGGHYEYLKIAEGCNKHCTYCIIPSLRGRYRSVPMEELVEEAQGLVDEGVRELILVAEETTVYGVDLYGKKSLHILLKKLCRIRWLKWIRILYCYPEEIYPELIRVMKEEPKICHYLDLPIQHADDEILRRMGRRTTRAGLTELILRLRREIPDIVLRTTLISGFPGETEEQHRSLLEFVREMRFDRLGVFAYSREEGTKAAEMDGQIDDEVRQARRDEIMETQQQISLEKGKERVGSVMEVQIEGYLASEDVYAGRTFGDAPGVDGYCFVTSDVPLESGDFVRVRIEGAAEYDLAGTLESR
ncbi:MAG: 30S ribosomal protein S12 methylthiotransferase RimO [Bilifractor sp.]